MVKTLTYNLKAKKVEFSFKNASLIDPELEDSLMLFLLIIINKTSN
jgi:hypothetical protein